MARVRLDAPGARPFGDRPAGAGTPRPTGLGNRTLASLAAGAPVLARYLAEEHIPRRLRGWSIALTGSVGRGGDNADDEVWDVRTRLETLGFPAGRSIADLGRAIAAYQREVLGFQRPDGRIDPGGMTHKALNAFRTRQKKAEEPKPPGPTPKPPGPTPKPPGPEPEPPPPGPEAKDDIDLPDRKLEPGDHVWYYRGRFGEKASMNRNIPNNRWFGTKDGTTNYRDEGEWIFHFVIHAGGEIRRGKPHLKNHAGTFAWLYNNPGNLMGGPSTKNYRGKRGWHGFVLFPTFQDGYEAIGLLLTKGGYPAKTKGKRRWPAGRYRDLSIVEAFHRYAPEEDGNDPETYGRDVARAAGVSPTEKPISELDDAQVRLMQDKIVEIEKSVPALPLLNASSPQVPEVIRAKL